MVRVRRMARFADIFADIFVDVIVFIVVVERYYGNAEESDVRRVKVSL